MAGSSFAKLTSSSPCPTSHWVLFLCTLPWDQNCSPSSIPTPSRGLAEMGSLQSQSSPALWPLYLITYLLCLPDDFWSCSQMQCQATQGGFSWQGWWWQRILIAQGDGDRDSASHAVRAWSGCRKHHEGKVSANIHPHAAEARGRAASWEDCFTSGEEAESGQGWPSGHTCS